MFKLICDLLSLTTNRYTDNLKRMNKNNQPSKPLKTEVTPSTSSYYIPGHAPTFVSQHARSRGITGRIAPTRAF